MLYLFSLIIPFLSFLLQSYPRFFNKFFGVDVWTRLIEIDLVRKNDHRIPKKKINNQFIIDGYFDYPPLFPFIFSFFPKKSLLKYQGFISPLIDSLQVVLVFFIAYFLTNNPWLSITSQLIYLLTPMIAIENSYFTPRSFGYLLFSAAVIFFIFFFYQPTVLNFSIGIILTTLVFLSHRFATQSLVFLAIFLTFYFKSPVFILEILSGFLFAVFLTRGYYLRVLRGHFSNIYFWFLNRDKRFTHPIRGNVKTKNKDFVSRIYSLLSVFSPIALFGLNFWMLSGFIVFILSYLNMLDVPLIFQTFTAWILFFYVLAVITLRFKYFLCIGEGQRYLEMIAVPSAILSSYLVFEFLKTPYGPYILGLFIFFLMFNLAIIVFTQLKGIIKDKDKSLTADWNKIFIYINKMKTIPRIVCFPHQNTTMTMYHTKAKILVNADNPQLMIMGDFYPVLKVSVKALAEKYKLTHALVNESFATLAELKLDSKNIVFSSGTIKLVKLP